MNQKDRIWYVTLENSNLRDNYDTVHNVKDAQKISVGKGIKVGVVGKYFGFEGHKEFYAGGHDFIGDSEALNVISEHGYWMAKTLKEIAPGVEVYALNARSSNKDKQADGIVKAIDWAIENNIEILTYSDEGFYGSNKEKIDAAVNKGVRNNIVFTFIHYPNPNNFYPEIMTRSKPGTLDREPDLRIYHYDYNTLILDSYRKFLEVDGNATSGGQIPYFSNSSLSPVLIVPVLPMSVLDITPKENNSPNSFFSNIPTPCLYPELSGLTFPYSQIPCWFSLGFSYTPPGTKYY